MEAEAPAGAGGSLGERKRDWLEVKVMVDSKGIFRRDLGSRTCTIC